MIKEFKVEICIYFDVEIIANEFMASELSEYHLILTMERTRVIGIDMKLIDALINSRMEAMPALGAYSKMFMLWASR